MATAELQSVRGAALALKVNASTISRYLKEYPDLNQGSRTRPKIDVDVLRTHRADNTSQAQQRGPGTATSVELPPAATAPSNQPNYALAKAVRETVLAQRARVDLDEKRGLLVPRAEVENSVYDAGTVLLRDMLEIPAKLAERLVAMTDRREITALLETELRRVLATMATSLRADAAAEEAAKAAATGEVIPIDERRP